MPEHGHYHEVLDDLRPQHRALRQFIPEVYRAFKDMSGAALGAGALEPKFKELIAVVVGVVDGCDGCIASHARAAVKAGVTREEAAEAIGVAIMMRGGPATVYGARAFEAISEFAAADEPKAT